MIPKRKKKLRKNALAYKDYDMVLKAAKVYSMMELDRSLLQYDSYIMRRKMIGLPDYNQAIAIATKNLTDKLKTSRRRLAIVKNPMGAIQRFNNVVKNALSNFRYGGIRGWDFHVAPTKGEMEFSAERNSMSAKIPTGMLYRAGAVRDGYLSYLHALKASPLTGVSILGVVEELKVQSEVLGEVYVGFAAVFRSSERSKGLQYQWFCMGRKRKDGSDWKAPCGFGSDPDTAVDAAMRMSASFLRKELKGSK